MRTTLITTLLLLALCIAATGCKTKSGSREYIPGKGWVPN
jgi:predicted small secreted protein